MFRNQIVFLNRTFLSVGISKSQTTTDQLKASLRKRFCDFSFSQMTFELAERDRLTEQLQEKVSSLEKKLERNLSGDEHVQELLKEVITQLRAA